MEMKLVLEPMGIRDARPVKRAKLRVSGQDDSVQAVDVARALATLGECPLEEVKEGVKEGASFLQPARVRLGPLPSFRRP